MASSSSFVNLLASQGSVDLDSAETPLFSTQSLQESSVKERRKWSVKEDLILIGVWLNTSKDSIVGNEQKGATFWKRIVEYYNSSPLLVGTVPRELGQCKEQRSGQNDNDVMKAALDIFNSDQNIKFNLEHAWRELRHDVKCMGDEVDRRLNAALNKDVDEYFEDTYNNIVKNQTKKQSKRAYVERNREEGHTRLWNDYFSENPTFPPHLFRWRFRMNKAVFMRIVDRLSENFPFFQQRRDAVGRLGLSSLQKCTAALRMLAYGCDADAVDEYL
uniref:No apical meristem-associated C-terminal domain-containing protein n=1 Tax=Brassica oleracea var. oleracea TaxID=109376 RepID=A0A0D3A5T2_BRAOL